MGAIELHIITGCLVILCIPSISKFATFIVRSNIGHLIPFSDRWKNHRNWLQDAIKKVEGLD